MMEALDKQLSLARGENGLNCGSGNRQGKEIGMSTGGLRGIKAGVSSHSTPTIPGTFSPTPLHPRDEKEQEQDGSTSILPSHGIYG